MKSKASIYMFVSLAVLALFGSCGLFGPSSGSDTISNDDLLAFQKVFMSSYFAERGGAPVSGRALTPFLERESSSASRATVPVLTSLSFATVRTGSNTLAYDYPEPGQTTSFTASLVNGTPANTAVYDVTVTTSFSSGDLRQSYVEEYYVQDIGLNSAQPTPWNTGLTPDLQWTVDDPIVKKLNDAWLADMNGILTQDQTARIRQVLTFVDGTTRTEQIVSSSNQGGPKFDPAAFNVAGSLDLSQAFIPGASTDPNIKYSSVVLYYVTPSSNSNFWFWQGSNAQTILGVRYYTEKASSPSYTGYTASFEKTVSALTTTGGDFAGTVAGIYVGSAHEALAESVLRQTVVYSLNAAGTGPTGPGSITTNMKTRVVNIIGFKDFYISQLNSELAQLSSAASTIYKPSGQAEEIVAGDSTAFAFIRTQQTTPVTGTLPFAVVTSDLTGTGALAKIYAGIIEGTATISVTGAPASNLLPTGTTGSGNVASFNGQQAIGNVLDPAATIITDTMGIRGSVEAWIYMDTITNTAGIVHKGTAIDFSDECFSLQGWGNTGQIGIILDKPGETNTYDSVLSKTNLKAKTWYHIVASWDAAPSGGVSAYIKLYVNGSTTKGNKGTPSVNVYRENTSAVIIGSQLPSIYDTSYGYFGFDGKIVGANVYKEPLTDAEVTTHYNDSKNATGNW